MAARALKVATQRVIDATSNEMHELADESAELSAAYLRGAVPFKLAMSVCTRFKVHRLAHKHLIQIRRGQCVDTGRLRRLMAIHVAQIERMGSRDVECNRTYFAEMLAAIDANNESLARLQRTKQ